MENFFTNYAAFWDDATSSGSIVAVVVMTIIPIGIILAYICPIVGLYWYVRCWHAGKSIEDLAMEQKESKQLIAKLLKKEWIAYFAFVISWVSLTFFLSAAFEASLWFLPESWGGYDVELDQFISAQEGWARTMAIISSLCILWYMSLALKARIAQVKSKGGKPDNYFN
ncbi:hypothetical protein COU79_01140 [Candidatus Peregrinibacteria bacterium CG10_big_fil_rev_8_21_14_0_10_54_7]|nr:MAG: hypothetical protein COU79_01140 [Candidatus Peregrinibacteria bacterium CG10_big_fil_rev_8_21_14_0_10_54_7]